MCITFDEWVSQRRILVWHTNTQQNEHATTLVQNITQNISFRFQILRAFDWCTARVAGMPKNSAKLQKPKRHRPTSVTKVYPVTKHTNCTSETDNQRFYNLSASLIMSHGRNKEIEKSVSNLRIVQGVSWL